MELELKGRSCIRNTMTDHEQFPNELLGQKTLFIECRSENPPLLLDHFLNTSRDASKATGQNAEFLAGTDTVGDSHIFFIVLNKRT